MRDTAVKGWVLPALLDTVTCPAHEMPIAQSDSHHFFPSKGCALVQDTHLCFAVWPHILASLTQSKQSPCSAKAPGISIKLKSCSVLRRNGIFSDYFYLRKCHFDRSENIQDGCSQNMRVLCFDKIKKPLLTDTLNVLTQVLIR